MTAITNLRSRYPRLGRKLKKIGLAKLPTPVRVVTLKLASGRRPISIKYDNLTSELYGGNKVRKLEYLLRPTTRKSVRRIATFGTVGSHHALATALYSRQLGYECTCFLAHQKKTAAIPAMLDSHLLAGTEIVRYGGAYARRIGTLREYLWHRHAWVVPAGGSSWLGTVGFVDAGLELAGQVSADEIPRPDRLYVATGTMGTAAGLALGLALGELRTELHAVRVSHTDICNEDALLRLIRKTATMLRYLDPAIPEDLADRVNVRLRHRFFGGGYAHSSPETDAAIRMVDEQLGLRLESTYTGKSMAALISDGVDAGTGYDEVLYWNTYNTRPLPAASASPQNRDALPAEFLSYFP